jgi:hypothetical protein
MKRSSVLVFLLTLIIFSCASKKKIAGNDIARDGSSYEKAIVINETHEGAGVKDEYAWIRSNYPNANTRSQALAYHDKTPYDILNITTTDGKAISVYFDISKFYGHF